MTSPYQQVPNSSNSPAGLGNVAPLNNNGVGNANSPSQLTTLVNSFTGLNLNPFNQPPVMKTLVYSPDIRVEIATSGGKQYDVSSDVVRGSLSRKENSVSTFFCELANHKGQYTKDGGLFGRMDRITVFMKRVNWVQVFTGYLDVVPFAQMWGGNVTIRASCTLKRLLYTYWNPDLTASRAVFNQLSLDNQNPLSDRGIGDLLGNLVCWIGGFSPANVHIQDFPTNFLYAMYPEFLRISKQSGASMDQFTTLLEGLDHTPGPGSFADQVHIGTGPGLGPQVLGAPAYQQQVIAAVDNRGMGPSVADIQNSYNLEQLSASGQGTREPAVAEAFQQNLALGNTIQTQARSADAAILAFACVLAESQWIMCANPLVPESLNYLFESPASPQNVTGGTGLGLFQQPNGTGSVQQRMNAYASAGIFLDGLSKIPGWQNMDPATAISIVQKNNTPEKYLATLDAARANVEAIRAGQGKYTPENLPGGIGVSSLTTVTALGQTISGTSLGTSFTPGLSQNSPSTSSLPISVPGKPQPDAQGAVNCAMTAVGLPYKWGGHAPEEGGMDCSGLIWWAYKSIGVEVGKNTQAQSLSYRQKVPSLALAQPGDAIQINGGAHTVMYLGGGQILEASSPGVPIMPKPIYFSPLEISGIYRWCDWGGPDPTAPFNPVAGPGAPVGTGHMGGTSPGSDGVNEPIARNLFSYMFTSLFSDSIANFFSGEKSFIAAQPLIQEVQAVCRAGLRSFASAPNGDFIAYYPDYFGVDGKPIAMTIENIEMKDVRINLSDDAMTTHVYVNGSHMNPFGQVDNGVAGWLTSAGVATVENEALYLRLKKVVPGKMENLSGNALLQKYGVRPLTLEFSSVGSQLLEFLMACQVFMQKWAEQYDTTAKFTFMPELFPGMRVKLADTGIAVYVHEVNHSFDMEQGFTTEARIMAPSRPDSGKAVDGVMTNMPADATVASIPTSVLGG